MDDISRKIFREALSNISRAQDGYTSIPQLPTLIINCIKQHLDEAEELFQRIIGDEELAVGLSLLAKIKEDLDREMQATDWRNQNDDTDWKMIHDLNYEELWKWCRDVALNFYDENSLTGRPLLLEGDPLLQYYTPRVCFKD
jgi:hypothetical protein